MTNVRLAALEILALALVSASLARAGVDVRGGRVLSSSDVVEPAAPVRWSFWPCDASESMVAGAAAADCGRLTFKDPTAADLTFDTPASTGAEPGGRPAPASASAPQKSPNHLLGSAIAGLAVAGSAVLFGAGTATLISFVGENVRFPDTAGGFRHDLNQGKWHGPTTR